MPHVVAPHRLARCAEFCAGPLLVAGLASGTAAQATSPSNPTDVAAAPATRPAAAGEVAFNFPENIELRVLADYVSRRLGINLLYDADFASPQNTVTIRSPGPLSAEALLPMFRSVLRMKGYDLVAGAEAGWSRVVRVGAGGEADDGEPPAVQFTTLKHADASRVAQQVKQLLQNSRPLATEGAPNAVSATPPAPFDVIYDERTSQLGAMGPATLVAEAMRIARAIDVPVPREGEPIRFYKLTNATAADVLDTIRELHGLPRSGPARDASAARPAPTAGSAYAEGDGANGIRAASNPFGGSNAAANLPGVASRADASGRPAPLVPSGASAGDDNAAGVSAAATGGATVPGVTADPNTNTIIVMGGTELQQRYGTLIKELDKRRPQVLLEATIVTLDTSNRFSFGVEIGGRSNGDGKRVITFSQFGLSDVDRDSGRLRISPGTGFNGALVGADIADVVVQALAANDRARVQSAPRVLVNDNATGTLSSVAEQPFTSINAGDTIATTSFGGYAEAGTTVTLTPHISDGDYLQLEYSVELSSFSGDGDVESGSPPPRQTNKIESRVTIPDGSTIIVGGLNRTNLRRAKQSIPILGEIPILEYLFSNRRDDDSTTTLFVFLRPIILRDDAFEDLKNLSERDVKRAGLPGDWPASEPLLIRG